MSSQMFHGNYIRENGWSMENCVNCHGEDYDGGASGVACYKCHQQGPEACNVCHGNNEHIHPPEDLENNIETSALGVGAHEIHLARYDCSLCHSVPDGFDDPAHIDQPPAEVNEQWTWDREAATCVTFCHGPELVWNDF